MEKDIKNILKDLYNEALMLSFKIVDDRLKNIEKENEHMFELEKFLVGTMQNIKVCLEKIDESDKK